MNELVTLQQASDHLRRDTEDDNDDLLLKIAAASQLVLDYLGDAADFTDSDGMVLTDTNGDPLGVPERVQEATLAMVSYLYRNRDAEQPDRVQAGYGYLPQGVVALLYSMRNPVIA